MKSAKILISAIVIIFGTTQAQSYNGYNYLYYYRNTQTPVETALGGMTSISNPSVFGHNDNPAHLANVESNQLDVTYRLNYSGDVGKNKYRSFNINYRFDDIGVLGLTYMKQQVSGTVVFDYGLNFDPYYLRQPENDYFSLSLARNLISDFYIGLTFDYVRVDTYLPPAERYQGIDLGILYKKKFTIITVNNTLSIGAEADNILRFKDIFSAESENDTDGWYLFPQMINIAISNKVVSPQSIYEAALYSINIQARYSDEINTEEYSLFSFGTELTFLEILTFRYGYAEGNKRYDRLIKETYVPKNTFGFGLNIPLGEWLKKDIPLSLRFDYGHSSQRLMYEYQYIREYAINVFSFGISLNNL